MVTQANVIEDIRVVSENLSDTTKELVKPSYALMWAFFFPVVIIAGYLIALAYVKLTYIPYVNAFGDMVYFSNAMSAEIATNLFGVLFAIVVGGALYGPALAYLSVPEKIRNTSLVISSLRKTCKKTVATLIGLNWCISLLGATVNTIFLCAAPAMILLSVFITQFVINSEVTRFGFASVIDKLNKIVKKI